MLGSTQKIFFSELANHVIHDVDLANLFTGTPARRYALVNKALKQQELLQVRRGLYMLAPQYRRELFSSYYIANHVVPYSFVTAESALQFHQWIPERVTEVVSIAGMGRKHQFNTPVGSFVYYVPKFATEYFWQGVKRALIGKNLVWMATPLRALLDYVYLHKVKNADKHFLQHSLRIEKEQLRLITPIAVKNLLPVYKHIHAQQFLANLLDEI